MSPKVPEAYREARLAEILTAAEDSFLEKGLHATTMQDIYRRTRLSPGAVYNYFSSRDDIVVAAAQRFNEWSVAQMTSRLTENPDESLIDILRFWLDLLRPRDRKQVIVMQLDFYAEATRNPAIREAMVASQDAIHEVLAELIKHRQQEGAFDPSLDAESVARAIMSLTFGAAIHRSLEPDTDLDAYTAVCEAMLRGLLAAPPDKK